MRKIITICIILVFVPLVMGMAKQSSSDWPENCYVIWALKKDSPQQSVAVSPTDWFIWQKGAWGKPGIRYIINKCAAAGIRTIWWRTHAGGLATYPTKLSDATYYNCPYRGISYEDWDSLKLAIDYAHELDMKIYAWMTPLEETHGWADTVRSKYMDLHPEYSDINKVGQKVGIPSFYFEGYREYKESIVCELLETWDFDGLVLDFERLGAPKRSDNWGYIPDLMSEFEKKTGLDPRDLAVNNSKWINFRSSFVGKFVESAKKITSEIDRPFELVLMGVEGQEYTSHVNLNLWSKGCDAIAMGNYSKESNEKEYGWIGDPDTAFMNIKSKNISKIFIAYAYYGEGKRLIDAASIAKRNGANICWFESTPLNYRKMFWVPAKVGLEKDIRLVKKIGKDIICEKSIKTVSFKVLGYCNWKLAINGSVIADGIKGGGCVLGPYQIEKGTDLTIEFITEGPFGGSCGLAAVVYLQDETGFGVPIVTDATWKTILQDKTFGVTSLMGKPDAAPFVVNFEN